MINSADTIQMLADQEIIEDHTTTKNDAVRHPNHYQLEGLGCESIDVIKAVIGEEGFKKFCRGNTLKYLMRADKKNGTEDLRKAKVYLEWEIEGR